MVFEDQWIVWFTKLRDWQAVFCKGPHSRYVRLWGPHGLCRDSEGLCFSTYMCVWVCQMFWEFTSNKEMKPHCDDMTQLELGRHPVSPSRFLRCLLCGLFHAVQFRCLISSDQSKHSPRHSHLPWNRPCRAEGVTCITVLFKTSFWMEHW